MPLEDLGEEIFCAGLASRAGDREHGSRVVRRDCTGEIAHSGHDIVDDDSRESGWARSQQGHCTCGERVRRVLVAVGSSAYQAGEQTARCDVAGIERGGCGDHAERVRDAVEVAAGGLGNLGQCHGDHR